MRKRVLTVRKLILTMRKNVLCSFFSCQKNEPKKTFSGRGVFAYSKTRNAKLNLLFTIFYLIKRCSWIYDFKDSRIFNALLFLHCCLMCSLWLSLVVVDYEGCFMFLFVLRDVLCWVGFVGKLLSCYTMIPRFKECGCWGLNEAWMDLH